VSSARTLAFNVLLAVERGGYASDLLAARAKALDPRDAGLASEIVFGVLRYQAQLDYLIGLHTKPKLDIEVRLALRMGIYQLRYLDRIPRHAAVSEAVELVKRARKRSAVPLVNAVLRKITREPVAWPSREIGLSHPEWMLARWEAQYGLDTAEIIARANLRPPETWVRAPEGGRSDRLEPTDIPGCYRLISGPTEGFRIQDIGSQAIVPLLRLEPGQAFLDVCAAPGNKTAQALESSVQAIACDIHPQRLERLRELGIPLLVLNGTQPLPFGRRFDRILVDAPCSGTGTLARNPEIKWRLRPGDLPVLRERQAVLLRNALAALAPGGILVYSTCSLEREENEEVVATVVRPSQVAETMRRIPGRDPGDGFFAAVINS
jgi:16S rRNA (cytosine967-C5)-methyltransferase